MTETEKIYKHTYMLIGETLVEESKQHITSEVACSKIRFYLNEMLCKLNKESEKKVVRMNCDRNKCYEQEYNGEGCDTCDNNIEDMIKALRCLGSVHLDSCYMKQYNQKHPNDKIYCKKGSCPHYQETYGVCFGDDDTSWLVLAADELERLSGERE